VAVGVASSPWPPWPPWPCAAPRRPAVAASTPRRVPPPTSAARARARPPGGGPAAPGARRDVTSWPRADDRAAKWSRGVSAESAGRWARATGSAAAADAAAATPSRRRRAPQPRPAWRMASKDEADSAKSTMVRREEEEGEEEEVEEGQAASSSPPATTLPSSSSIISTLATYACKNEAGRATGSASGEHASRPSPGAVADTMAATVATSTGCQGEEPARARTRGG